MKYQRYLEHVTRQPWAITPEKLSEIRSLMIQRVSGNMPTLEQITAAVKSRRPHAAARIVSLSPQASSVVRASFGGDTVSSDEPTAVAVIPICGAIAYRGGAFGDSSGGASARRIGRQIDAAADDSGVKALLLEFDTPGGSVEGIPELAAKINAVRARKPVWAQVSPMSASAGYWLTSQCDRVHMMQSGMVGSVGVYMLSVDESEMLANIGIKIEAIQFGENKLEGAPWLPMSDGTRAHLKSMVDALGMQFVNAVASGRGVSAKVVMDTFGQGRMFQADDALRLGMVDGIATIDATLAMMLTTPAKAMRSTSTARAAAGRTAAMSKGFAVVTPLIVADDMTGDPEDSQPEDDATPTPTPDKSCDCPDCVCTADTPCADKCPTCVGGCACRVIVEIEPEDESGDDVASMI